MIEGESTKRLLRKAIRALARRAQSRAELKARLSPGADETEVQQVLSRLEELNLLNDEQYAYNFALWRMKQDGWGPAKALNALLRRRVETRLAEAAVERVRREAGDATLLQEYMSGYCRKYPLPQDRSSIQRLISRLQRRGFPDEVIFGVLRQLIPASSWNRFERGD